jgi:polysaccharide biosynthesis protein PslH
MARILSVVWFKFLPARFGGQKGIAAFNEHLSFHHTLLCLCSKNNQSDQINYTLLPALPVGRAQVINPLNWLKINRKIRELGISHLILEHCYYGLAGIWAKKKLSVTLIVHAHNIESTRFREMGKWWWYLLYLLEKKTFSKADLIIFKTLTDQDFAINQWGIKKHQCIILPYGLNRQRKPTAIEKEKASAEIRHQYQIAPGEKILLFSGTLDYKPNADGLCILVDIILPILCNMTDRSFRLIVCGRIIYPGFEYLLSLNHPNYIYAGLVEDPEKYLLAADIFLNPVVEGGGIKVKTMDALAFNLTVISCAHSATGIDLNLTGEKLKVCPDNSWQQFCRLILATWDEEYDTPDAFYQYYQWSKVIQPFLEKIKRD